MTVGGESDLSEVEFQDCLVVRIEVIPDSDVGKLPLFRRCYFGRVDGRTGEADLDPHCFVDCTFGEFEHTASTTHSLLALPLPIAARVTLTILKKLYLQSGNGRKETALFRGLDAPAKATVRQVLELLRTQHFAVKAREGAVTIWLPVRDSEIRQRALRILGGPTSSADPLMEEARDL